MSRKLPAGWKPRSVNCQWALWTAAHSTHITHFTLSWVCTNTTSLTNKFILNTHHTTRGGHFLSFLLFLRGTLCCALYIGALSLYICNSWSNLTLQKELQLHTWTLCNTYCRSCVQIYPIELKYLIITSRIHVFTYLFL